MTHRYPEVRGGICEWCGVLDPFTDSIDQYKLCPHFRNMQLACSYCPMQVDQNEVIRRTVMRIQDSPENPNELVVWCDNFECAQKHLARYQKNA